MYAQLADIAQEENISLKYLEQIVRALRPSGILRTARGAKGGYALAQDPKDITLDVVFLHLEGALSPIPCLEKDGACSRRACCSSRRLWEALDTHIQDFLHRVTLNQVLECCPADPQMCLPGVQGIACAD